MDRGFFLLEISAVLKYLFYKFIFNILTLVARTCVIDLLFLKRKLLIFNIIFEQSYYYLRKNQEL